MKERKQLGGLTSMASAMIPGARVDRKGRILVNVATSQETITFNIGGTMFETYRSTLFRIPHSPLANDKFLQKHYRPERKDYFFDRDPDIFRATLNYLRTGELHMPSYICGPAAKMELEYWGLSPSLIERCCWTNYNDWNCTLEALDQLDYDRNCSALESDDNPNTQQTWWRRQSIRAWHFLNSPDSSFGARIYGISALILVFMSIFTFVAGTMPYFASYKTFVIDSVGNYSDAASYDASSNDVNSTTTSNMASEDKSNAIIQTRHPVLATIDIICLVFFTLEYISRIIFAPKKLKFVTSVLGMIDLFAILPEYIEFLVYAARPDILLQENGFDFISCFKIMRVLRIFRLIKHVPGLWILVYTLKSSFGELILLLCFMMVGTLLFSSLIYFAEDRSTFVSIPASFWWAIITMTTVGYGDMYPETVAGKLIGSFCAMTGLLMIGFSVPALVNNFLMYYKHVQYSLNAEREASTGAGDDKAWSTATFATSSKISDNESAAETLEMTSKVEKLEESESLISNHNGL